MSAPCASPLAKATLFASSRGSKRRFSRQSTAHPSSFSIRFTARLSESAESSPSGRPRWLMMMGLAPCSNKKRSVGTAACKRKESREGSFMSRFTRTRHVLPRSFGSVNVRSRRTGYLVRLCVMKFQRASKTLAVGLGITGGNILCGCCWVGGMKGTPFTQ